MPSKNFKDPAFLLRNIMSNLPELIYFKDIYSRFIWVNDAFCERVGMTMTSLYGKNDFHLYHNDHAMAAYQCEQQIIATGEPVVGLEEMEKYADGHIQWVSTTKVPLRDEDGTIIGTFGVSRDITEKKLLEEELLGARKLESIGQLAAGVAHEINTPIQFVGNNLNFLDDSVSDLPGLLQKSLSLLQQAKSEAVDVAAIDAFEKEVETTDLEYLIEEIPQAIRQSLEGTGRVAEIVRAMKNFSHPDTQEMESADLNEAIRTTVQVSRNEWKYDCRLELDLCDDLPFVPCHLGAFNQVILNMIVNARDAIHEVASEDNKGTITISTVCEDEWAVIRVHDTGCGMSEQVQARIFDPFYTTKEVGKGTGQGLSISHNVIVRQHHGKLTVSSDVGQGSTFEIRLPLKEHSQSADDADT